MKLLLTSDGLSSKKLRKELVKLLDKPPAENRVIIMHTARLKRQFFHLRKVKDQLKKSGFKRKNIVSININKKVNAKKYANFDVFFSCGGNTFYILNRVRKTGFNQVIKNFIKKNKLYVGISAGSILVHKTIEIAGWGSAADKNEINLKNLKGLGLTSVAVFPHFKKRLAKEVSAFKRKVNYPVKIIRDRQAILIIGKTARLIA